MSDNFLKLCDEVLRATKFISNYEECRPHYQRVLDYIVAHLNERDEMAKAFSKFVTDGGYPEVSLVEFLMGTLKWPEIKIVAEARLAQEGNMYFEVERIVSAYK